MACEEMLAAEEVSGQDLAALAAALGVAGLPADDLHDPGRLFWRFRDPAGQVAGYAGLECYGAEALLRSVVVIDTHRGMGLGRAISEAALRKAATCDARRVWLLTNTAADFFEKLGFTPCDRSAAPAAIKATREFSTLCPDTAALLCRPLA